MDDPLWTIYWPGPEAEAAKLKAELFAEGNIADLKDFFDIVIETEHDRER